MIGVRWVYRQEPNRAVSSAEDGSAGIQDVSALFLYVGGSGGASDICIYVEGRDGSRKDAIAG